MTTDKKVADQRIQHMPPKPKSKMELRTELHGHPTTIPKPSSRSTNNPAKPPPPPPPPEHRDGIRTRKRTITNADSTNETS